MPPRAHRLSHGDAGKQMATRATAGDQDFEGLGHRKKCVKNRENPDPDGSEFSSPLPKHFLIIRQCSKTAGHRKFWHHG
jgi:hypothetical protein